MKPSYEELEKQLAQLKMSLDAIRSGKVDNTENMIGFKNTRSVQPQESHDALETHHELEKRPVDPLQKEITERQQAELALSEEKYRRLIENMSDEFFFYSHNTHGLFTFVSHSVQNTLGYTPEEFMTHYTEYLTDNPINEKVKHHLELSIQGIVQPSYEVELCCQDGTIKTLEISEVPTLDEQDQVVSVEGIAHDITKRKQAEKALQKSYNRFTAVTNSLDAVVYVSDFETYELLFMNQFALNIWGKNASGKICWQTLQTGQTGPCSFCTNDKLLDQQRKPTGIYVWEFQNTADGEWYQCRDQAIQWPDGRLVRMEIATNITERKRMEEKLLQSEQRYRRLFTDNKAVELLIDPINGQIVDFNAAAVQYYGYSEAELKSLNVADINTLSKEEIANEMHNAQREQRNYFSFKHRLASGEIRDVEVYSGPIELDGQHLLYSVIHDTTAWKTAEAKLEKAKKQAEAANRAKSEFLANMSHEIRTPMNAVIGFSDILASKITDKQQQGYLNSIQTAGKSLLTLINDILDLSKISAGRLEIQYDPVNPRLIFTELQQIFSLKMAEKKLEFMMEIDENLPQALFLDETRLRQVLLNLMGNAIKFTDSGYVKLRATKKVYANQKQIDLILAVEDSGIGIQPNQQTLIFESFRQQDGQSTRQYGGTGLGLAITKRLVEMMNGQIAVESNPGKGSLFEVTLRQVEIAATTPKVKPDNTFDLNNITFQKTPILVVDDIKSNRDLIEEYLSQVNLEVISAEDGQTALLFAEEYHPALILMDIKMPEMDGYETTTRLKDNPNTANIPIIALTASATSTTKVKIKNMHGFDGYLAKPVNISELLRELSHYLKYTKKAVNDASPALTTEADSTVNPTEIANLSELRGKIEQQVMPLWKKANIMMKMDVVIAFAEKIIELGHEYHVPTLIHYGEPLQESTQTFDIPYIQKALQEFPVLVKPLMID